MDLGLKEQMLVLTPKWMLVGVGLQWCFQWLLMSFQWLLMNFQWLLMSFQWLLVGLQRLLVSFRRLLVGFRWSLMGLVRMLMGLGWVLGWVLAGGWVLVGLERKTRCEVRKAYPEIL